MYNNFFGFKENPFELDPNPDYLFMSKNHGETLAHLIFAVSHGGGFVEITGVAGTGKTILCKACLGNLDESFKAAYLLGRDMDALQFLKALYDKFGIHTTPENTKELIEILTQFLIEKKAAGENFLLLMDDAHSLSQEVLDLLLLLSNPEITQKKLLQIILVGQPELKGMLSSGELKQLKEQITVNCQLVPLTFQETIDYIRHRISLAAHRACPPFDKASCRAIYEYSKGVPQKINIACDMTLLHAFNRKSFNITGAITREAIKELTQTKPEKPYEEERRERKKNPVPAIVSAVLITLVITVFYFVKLQSPEPPAIKGPVANTKALINSGPIDTAVNTQKIPETTPANNHTTPDENIFADPVPDIIHALLKGQRIKLTVDCYTLPQLS
ncbi:ExeA family protein [Thermodesulfobacteriota bacterium]